LALIDTIQQQLDDKTVSQLSQQLGADPNTTRQAVPAALSALLGGLSQNVQQPGGAQQLENALANHGGGGGLLDSLGGLGGLLGGGGGTMDGGGILGHIFGNHQPAVASQVGQRTGLNAGQAARLLMLLAPFVLGSLNRARQQGQQQAPAGNLGAGGVPATTGGAMGDAMGSSAGSGPFGGITDILHGERTRIEEAHPEHRGILGDLFDRNHDGHIMDDVAGMAGGLLRGGR
jgi:hypothetical protein